MSNGSGGSRCDGSGEVGWDCPKKISLCQHGIVLYWVLWFSLHFGGVHRGGESPGKQNATFRNGGLPDSAEKAGAKHSRRKLRKNGPGPEAELRQKAWQCLEALARGPSKSEAVFQDQHVHRLAHRPPF